MIIIERKERDHIYSLLARYKRKRRRLKVDLEIRQRRQFTKPSVKRRNELLKAAYQNEKKLSGDLDEGKTTKKKPRFAPVFRDYTPLAIQPPPPALKEERV